MKNRSEDSGGGKPGHGDPMELRNFSAAPAFAHVMVELAQVLPEQEVVDATRD